MYSLRGVLRYSTRGRCRKLLQRSCQQSRQINSPSVRGASQEIFRPEIAQAANLLDIGTQRMWTEEHDEFRRHARKFFTEEAAPNKEKWEAAGIIDREIFLRAGELGLLGVATPAELGGHGRDLLYAGILWEEQWRANCSVPVMALQSDVCMTYLVLYGTQDQQRKFLPRMAEGSVIGAIAMTEPHAGSDLQAIRTNARRDGDGWVLNGSKVFISHGILADLAIVAAVTRDDVKSPAHGISLFLVERGMPGFSRGRNLNKLGLKAEDTAELFFEDVRLGREHLLGEENKGWFHMMSQLPQERMIVAARGQGHMEWIFEKTREHIKQGYLGGMKMADSQVIRHKMAELKTLICASRAFYNDCLWAHHKGRLTNEMSAMAKYWLTDRDDYVASTCLSLFDQEGALQNNPIARAMLDARVQSIWAGSNEIMKNIVARQIVMG